MPGWVFVIGGIVVLVAALLAVDWFTAGRARRRMGVRAREQQVGNADVDYTVIQRQGDGGQQSSWTQP